VAVFAFLILQALRLSGFTWKPGTVDAVTDLKFNSNAFSSLAAVITAVDAGGGLNY
jgi:hypothetical protein